MTLNEFFSLVPKAAVAFSGGTDSAFLLWAARECGCEVRAYYGKTAFQPQFELEDARRLASELEVPMTVVEADILSVPEAAANGPQRCYHCKTALFSQLWAAARDDGYTVLLSHRPELFSVYREAGVDLALAGHVHGGQFRFPWGGGLIAPNQGLFPKYTQGLYEEEGGKMIVSRGLGNSSVPIRLFNRPEVVAVTLKK